MRSYPTWKSLSSKTGPLSHRLLASRWEKQVSRQLLHQHFSAGQCPSLQSTSIQRGHRSQPPLVTLTSSLAGLNIRRRSSEACVSEVFVELYTFRDSSWCNDKAEEVEVDEMRLRFFPCKFVFVI